MCRFCSLQCFSMVWLGSVLNDERDSAIAGIFGMVGMAQALVCKSAHLRYLVCPDPVRLHQLPTLIGAIGRKFPIRKVVSLSKWFRVCVALDEDPVWEFPKLFGEER